MANQTALYFYFAEKCTCFLGSSRSFAHGKYWCMICTWPAQRIPQTPGRHSCIQLFCKFYTNTLDFNTINNFDRSPACRHRGENPRWPLVAWTAQQFRNAARPPGQNVRCLQPDNDSENRLIAHCTVVQWYNLSRAGVNIIITAHGQHTHFSLFTNIFGTGGI